MKVWVLMVGIVLMLIVMMRMLLMLARCCCGPVLPCADRLRSGAPVHPSIHGAARSLCTAINPGPGNSGAGEARMEGAGGHGESLMLIQREGVVMEVMMMMMVVVSRFRRSISRSSPRSITDGVFHIGVHVVHAELKHSIK